MRFGKKVAIVFSLFASAVIFFVCFSKHFEHNIAHYILIGTLLTIIYFVGNIMDMEKSHREKLAFLSTHDELTGVTILGTSKTYQFLKLTGSIGFKNLYL
ncbi:hypothetical protein N752_23840 [Desulforamulus aquiferis]|nr:hypothetical protein N752_23840 [Desulforamulus aquiferis]